ncbi:hypothetical protein [Sphingosinicella sp. CPCC 101087]|uniref:hypothetical protein n=1 Tax=Sphingosinicella sp. CPCC 101087 TaxID=2497754 RepID=UPI0013E9B928|nr:hypothetical protein [Sphingosinicella sp. CPCC 101087]
MIRRRHRRHGALRPPCCLTAGCGRRPRRDRLLCTDCWYRIGTAIRLAIEEAREARLFADMRRMSRAAARIIDRADRRSPPAAS